MGYEAVSSAAQETGQGNFGAGMGAKAGTLKGGMGSVSLMDDEGNIVGSFVGIKILLVLSPCRIGRVLGLAF